MMPCSRAARTSWTAPTKAGEAHIRRPFGSAMTCTFMPCFLCFPEGSQEADGLGDVSVGGGGADPESGRELGVGLAVAQVGEGEQGLSACVQAPPSGSESAAVFPQAGGEEAQGRAGHVGAGRVDKHAKPLVETVLLVENPSTRGFICLSAQLPSCHVRLERAHCLP